MDPFKKQCVECDKPLRKMHYHCLWAPKERVDEDMDRNVCMRKNNYWDNETELKIHICSHLGENKNYWKDQLLSAK